MQTTRSEVRMRLQGSWPIIALTTAIFTLYAVYAVSRQSTQITAGYDLGIFDQAVRDYAHFRAPIVPLKGTHFNIFADHFHPIIATIAPLYWLWDSPYVLLLVQVALVAASVPIVHRFARRRMTSAPALVVSGAYALGWAIQAGIDFDFHEIAFAVPLLAWAIDALDRRDYRSLLISCGLLLLVREDMGVVVATIGFLCVIQRPRTPRWLGLGLIALGGAAFVVITSVVIPHFSPDGKFGYFTFDSLGPDLPHAVLNLFIHPVKSIKVFLSPWVKTQTLLFFLVPLAFLPLRSRYALIALPLLAQRFFNSREHLWITHFHYSMLPWLVLVLAMIDGADRFALWNKQKTRAALMAWLAVVPIWLAIRPAPTVPLIHRMLNGSAWLVDEHLRAKRASLAVIPRDVCVSVDDRLAPQITNRDRVTLPGILTPRTDFYVLDMSQDQVGFPLASPQTVYAQAIHEGYRVIFSREHMRVLQSPSYSGPSVLCKP